ncbi:transketolase family protein [bacterium]|nr:transketolase family protein [bacterium]
MSFGASRDGYGEALLELSSNEKVVVLEADLGKSTKSCWFRAKYPERTFSFGIAEQNMVLAAAGLASSGYIPFASTFSIFCERAFEQMRNGVARPGYAVHLCGSHGGIHTGEDGSSAQAIEDLSVFRSIPKLTVLHPCDDISARILTCQLAESRHPSYTRTARNKVPRLYEGKESVLRIGKGVTLRQGRDVAILAVGVMVHRALDAAQQLSKEGIEATVADFHTLKPLDEDLVGELAHRCGAFVTAEDHSLIGGLGGAVAESLSQIHPVPLERVGVKDRFGESGKPEPLMDMMGLTAEDIVAAAKRAITRKETN